MNKYSFSIQNRITKLFFKRVNRSFIEKVRKKLNFDCKRTKKEKDLFENK